MTDITIIGGGPAGLRTAELLARKGQRVTALEEHAQIGRPVQCTGIVTSSLKETMPIKKEFLVNRLGKAVVHSPGGSVAEIKLNDYVLDRAKFDQHMAERAEKAGATILLNTRAESIKEKKVLTKKKVIRTDVIIGADGPNSIVSKYLCNKKPEFWTGVQARASMPVDKESYHVYFGKDIPGFFGWVVPEDEETARIGVAANINSRHIFDRFTKRFEKMKIIEMQGGLMPKYDPAMIIEKENMYLVGDAALQVKATTGGGIVPGLQAAECLAEAILSQTSYKKELHSVTRELKTSLLIRKILDRFNDADYNKLIEILDKEKIRDILNKTDRDNPTKIIFKAILTEPRLLMFAKVLFQRRQS